MSTKYMISLLKRLPMAALLVVAALAVPTAPVLAQESEIAPEHLALARKYVDLTDKVNIYEVTLLETGLQTLRTLTAQNPELTAPVEAAITSALETYRDRKSELMDQFARIYAQRFAVEELEQIVAFYESPVGTKLATENATINQDLQRVMQVFEVNLKTEFFAMVRATLRSEGYDV